MSSQKIEYRIILIGNSGVGKTSLFKKLTTKNFVDNNMATIGVDKRTYSLNIDIEKDGKTINKDFQLSLVDTAGQERYKAIIRNYYKEANGVLLMYDITNNSSFKNVEVWLQSIEQNIQSDPGKYIIFLIGNKLDLIGQQLGNKTYEREVEEEDAEELCKQKKLEWGGEMSVKNITDDELENLLKNYVKKLYGCIGDNQVKQQGVHHLGSFAPPKKKSRCPLF
jgi:small GTP-binding protein